MRVRKGEGEGEGEGDGERNEGKGKGQGKGKGKSKGKGSTGELSIFDSVTEVLIPWNEAHCFGEHEATISIPKTNENEYNGGAKVRTLGHRLKVLS